MDAFTKARKEGKLNSMKFVTTVDRDEDGVWIVEYPSIPGCVSQGEPGMQPSPTSGKPSPPALRYEPSAACR